MTFDLRSGRWQDVLADVEVDETISDPPYGERTHDGHNSAENTAISGFQNDIDYSHWTPEDVHAFVAHWSPRTIGWLVGMTSHDLIPAWEQALCEAGRYVFAPLPFLDIGKGPRVLGDGPASWTVQIIVARPRSMTWLESWRQRRKARGLSTSLPGGYLRERGDVVWSPPGGGKRIGGKPPGFMRRIVEDYSEPGDLVCDPYSGHATTLRVALELGRRAIGAEVDPDVHAAALARLREPIAMALPGLDVAPAEQAGFGW